MLLSEPHIKVRRFAFANKKGGRCMKSASMAFFLSLLCASAFFLLVPDDCATSIDIAVDFTINISASIEYAAPRHESAKASFESVLANLDAAVSMVAYSTKANAYCEDLAAIVQGLNNSGWTDLGAARQTEDS
jgi:hypothetical protein